MIRELKKRNPSWLESIETKYFIVEKSKVSIRVFGSRITIKELKSLVSEIQSCEANNITLSVTWKNH